MCVRAHANLYHARAVARFARKNLATAQAWYKRDHNTRVRTILRVRTGEKFFLTKPPGPANADTTRADTVIQSNLSPPASGPHRFIRSSDTTAKISVDGLHETVSLDGIALVPPASASTDDASANNPPYAIPL